MKITRYRDECVRINGHNFVAVHEINEHAVCLFMGCDCGDADAVLTFEDGEHFTQEDVDMRMDVSVGLDGEGTPCCTLEFTLPEGITVEREESVVVQ